MEVGGWVRGELTDQYTVTKAKAHGEEDVLEASSASDRAAGEVEPQRLYVEPTDVPVATAAADEGRW